VNCFRDRWWVKWQSNGWKNSKKEPVANTDLWMPLIELVKERQPTFRWVKGHSGHPMNDLVDRLAVAESAIAASRPPSTPSPIGAGLIGADATLSAPHRPGEWEVELAAVGRRSRTTARRRTDPGHCFRRFELCRFLLFVPRLAPVLESPARWGSAAPLIAAFS